VKSDQPNQPERRYSTSLGSDDGEDGFQIEAISVFMVQYWIVVRKMFYDMGSEIRSSVFSRFLDN
jgi:hypothetical protein